MAEVMPVEAWYVLSVLLAPVGYVVQDVVADAMTVEAVPRVDPDGSPVDPARRKLMHTTMQTLGRVAIIGGGVLVALANIWLFAGVDEMSEADKVATYILIYELALADPGDLRARASCSRPDPSARPRRLRRSGHRPGRGPRLLDGEQQHTEPNWWILGGSLVFVVFTLTWASATCPTTRRSSSPAPWRSSCS
jgi:hypothetical protein